MVQDLFLVFSNNRTQKITLFENKSPEEIIHRCSSSKISSGSACEHLQSKRSRRSWVAVAPPGSATVLVQDCYMERAGAGRSLTKQALGAPMVRVAGRNRRANGVIIFPPPLSSFPATYSRPLAHGPPPHTSAHAPRLHMHGQRCSQHLHAVSTT